MNCKIELIEKNSELILRTVRELFEARIYKFHGTECSFFMEYHRP